MAMAHGLEVRSPFLDTELAEFVLRLPPLDLGLLSSAPGMLCQLP